MELSVLACLGDKNVVVFHRLSIPERHFKWCVLSNSHFNKLGNFKQLQVQSVLEVGKAKAEPWMTKFKSAWEIIRSS